MYSDNSKDNLNRNDDPSIDEAMTYSSETNSINLDDNAIIQLTEVIINSNSCGD